MMDGVRLLLCGILLVFTVAVTLVQEGGVEMVSALTPWDENQRRHRQLSDAILKVQSRGVAKREICRKVLTGQINVQEAAKRIRALHRPEDGFWRDLKLLSPGGSEEWRLERYVAASVQAMRDEKDEE